MEPDSETQLAKRFPDVLRWKADSRKRDNQLLELPAVLFAQLRQALPREGEGLLHSLEQWSGMPDPEELAKAWLNRPKIAGEALDVAESKIDDWLKAYELAWWEQAPGLADRLIEVTPEPPSYVYSCSQLLLGESERISIPLVAVDGEKAGRVQMLHLDVVRSSNEAALHMHPESEFSRSCFSEEFLSSIETAWQLAAGESSKRVTVFWQIAETDGKPIISKQQSGTSASAAAFRAFWHLRRGLNLDEEVYVLGSAAVGDGAVQDVGGLAQKIAAIHGHRHAFGIETPAAIILSSHAAERSHEDATAISQAASWAVVHEIATCVALTAVRSCESTAAILYLRHLADTLDQCRLLPMGKRLSEVHVPLQVWKDELIRPEHEMGLPDDSEANAPRNPNDRGSPPRKRPVRQPWDRVFHLYRGRSPLVLVGGPGSGKSTVLHWTARVMALEAVAALEARTCPPMEVAWPVLVNLDTWAAHEPKQQSRPSLISLLIGKVPVEWVPLERDAIARLIGQRLTDKTRHTFLFFDSLDQVASGRLVLLAKRLAALNDLTSSLVLTTRESGLRTHDEAIKTLPSPIKVESAPLTPEGTSTLAAKWLGPVQATRLVRHLRSHPSLGMVADSTLLLTLACLVTSQQPDQSLPETPAALYQEINRLLAQGRWRHGDDAPPACHNLQALLDQLPGIAWRLFLRSPGANRFDRITMLDAIEQITGRKGEARAEFLDYQFVECGFVEAYKGSTTELSYQFRHTTLLEFLAAKHLADNLNRDGWTISKVEAISAGVGWVARRSASIIEANISTPAWQKVLHFVAGLIHEPAAFFENLLNSSSADLHKNGPRMMRECLPNVSSCTLQKLPKVVEAVVFQLDGILQEMLENERIYPDTIMVIQEQMVHPAVTVLVVPKLANLIETIAEGSSSGKLYKYMALTAIIDAIKYTALCQHGKESRELLLKLSKAPHFSTASIATKACIETAVELDDGMLTGHWLGQLKASLDDRFQLLRISEELHKSRNKEVSVIAWNTLVGLAHNTEAHYLIRHQAFVHILGDTKYAPSPAFGESFIQFVQSNLKQCLDLGYARELTIPILDKTVVERGAEILMQGTTFRQRIEMEAMFLQIINDCNLDLPSRAKFGEWTNHASARWGEKYRAMLHNEFKLDTHDLGLARYQAASRLLIGGAEPPNQHTLKCIEEMMLNPGVACLYKLSIFRIASWRCPSILVDEIAPTILNDLYKCRESETMLLSSIEGNETHSSPEPEMKTHSDGNWLAGYLTKLPVWAECLEKAKRRVASQEKIDWLDMEIILREKNGAELLELLKLIQSSDANRVTLRKAILDELNKRGWRFKSPPKWRRFLFWRDQIKVLRAGD